MTDDDLARELADALAQPDRQPSPARIAAVRAAAEATRPATAAPRPGRASRVRRVAAVAAAAAALALAFVVGTLTTGGDDPPVHDGRIEFVEALRTEDGEAVGAVTGIRTGIGRVVQIRTDALPTLPTGAYYEAWFVSADDAPGDPDRISAGTFHPDEAGRSNVDLAAAVVPADYPTLLITAEPGDGDPAPSGVAILRADLRVDP